MPTINYSYDNDTVLLSTSDLVCDSIGTTITSATGGFTAAMEGESLHIISGSGFTPGYYTILSVVDTNTATTSNSVGASGSGGQATIGDAFDSSIDTGVKPAISLHSSLEQEFQVDNACYVEEVYVKLYAVYSGSGAIGGVHLSIWDSTRSTLVGESVQSIACDDITSSPAGEWVRLLVWKYDDDLGYIAVELQPSTTYIIRVGVNGGSIAYWLRDSDSTYSYGSAKQGIWDIYPTDWHYETIPGTFAFRLDGTYISSLSKPTTPTPANGSGPGINFTNRTVSWVNGGGADTYTVRMDSGDTPVNVVSLSQTGTSYTIPESDIFLYKDNIISWRVDAEAGGETVKGDVWTFDPRPAKATTPSPTNGASNTALNLTTLSWVKDAYTDTSEVNCSWSGSVSLFSTSSNSIALANYTPLYMDRLGYSNTYTWSVDTTNEWGTTDGDDWTFDTISYSGASCSWKNYDGKTKGPGVENGDGVEGVDYYWTGDNCISTVKRVVAFAADRVWITEV